MWCSTTTNICSSEFTSMSEARMGSSRDTSNGRETESATSPRAVSRSATRTLSQRSSSSAWLTGNTSACASSASEFWTNRVRKVSCRASTSINAECTTAGSTRTAPSDDTRRATNGRLYPANVFSENWLMNHIRCCAKESGMLSGRGSTAVIGGRPAPRSAVAVMSSRTEGASNTSRTDTSTPRASDTLAANRIADNELPPTSKNDSATETRSTPSTSPKTWARSSSVGVPGATYSAIAPLKSGAGNAFRSSFPAVLSTTSSRFTHTDGTM